MKSVYEAWARTMPDKWNEYHKEGNTLEGKIRAMKGDMAIRDEHLHEVEKQCAIGDWEFLRKVVQAGIMQKVCVGIPVPIIIVSACWPPHPICNGVFLFSATSIWRKLGTFSNK
jgi:hypothetical protein